MIPKIGKSGTSFSGLAAYLTHDPEAETEERVAWTHTENLANDHIPSAVDEMLWTYRDAELLKQEAGIRAGGRASEHPVKHISLNWAPSDNPSDQHMKDTARHFLNYMGWGEHQAIMVAHNDKEHKHLHIMINEVHPETGLRLNDGFEQRRAQKWAAAYEQAQGQIHCEQRFLDPADRTQSMPRNMWIAFKKNEQEFQKSEHQLREKAEIPQIKPHTPKKSEWEIFKQYQSEERDQFFAQYRDRFSDMRNSIYREVREEFREKWANYFEARKNSPDEQRDNLAAMRTQLVADQKAVFEPRKDAAYAKLKEERTQDYRELLDEQKLTRSEFRWRINAGLDTTDFLQGMDKKAQERDAFQNSFREAANEVTRRMPTATPLQNVRLDRESDEVAAHRTATPARSQRTDIADAGARKAMGAIRAFLDALFTDLTNLRSATPTNEPEPGARDAFEVAAEEATKQRVSEERAVEETQSIKRSRAIYGE
jgi:hypothetical protein